MAGKGGESSEMKTLDSVDFVTDTVDGIYGLHVTCGDCGEFAASDAQPTYAGSGVHPENEDGFYDETGWLRSVVAENMDEYYCPGCDEDYNQSRDSAWDKNREKLELPF